MLEEFQSNLGKKRIGQDVVDGLIRQGDAPVRGFCLQLVLGSFRFPGNPLTGLFAGGLIGQYALSDNRVTMLPDIY